MSYDIVGRALADLVTLRANCFIRITKRGLRSSVSRDAQEILEVTDRL